MLDSGNAGMVWLRMGATGRGREMKLQVRDELQERRQRVQETLQEALAARYETVVIMGQKDGQITVNSSATVSRLETIGALEIAKRRIWEVD